MSKKALDILAGKASDAVLETASYLGDEMALIKRDSILPVLALCKSDPDLDFSMLSDLTVVDWLGTDPRFEVVYVLYSIQHKHRLRLKVAVPEEDAVIDSACGLWMAANWAEREAWDLYGIDFRGHPDLRRILMYDEFVGHPLRKDYPQNGRQPLIRRPDATPTDDLTQRLLETSHDRRVE
ncbi:MAG: NADH-quinone oxidoreductase subunit C [Myxococcota bacterium]